MTGFIQAKLSISKESVNVVNPSKTLIQNVKNIVITYTIRASLNNLDVNAKRIITIANGERNINTGKENVIILSKPKFAIINVNVVKITTNALYEIAGINTLKYSALAMTEPIAVVKHANIITPANIIAPKVPK